ncbi:MAG: response regulator [Magnetococcales bacterium]|nr:response regulator [Magnetococcales bacterium]
MAHILVVDDDDLSRLYLVAILRNAGHTVQEAESGQKCLEQIDLNAVDLTITDIFMPVMDGFELLATLLKARPGSKVIAMSGGGLTMRKKLALHVAKKFGAIDLISKPFQSSGVLDTVTQALCPAKSFIACQNWLCRQDALFFSGTG